MYISVIFLCKQVTVNIKDVDFGFPQFTSDNVIYVSEATVVGSLVYTARAVSKDPASSGVMNYSILSGGANKFSFSSSTGGTLLLTSSLNNRLVAQYVLLISAVDSSTSQSAVMNLTINVSPANMFTPTFPQIYQTIQVPENTKCGSDLATVSAFDGDDGVNGEVYYTIATGDDCNAFNLDPVTGHLYLQHALHWDIKKSYSLVIVAYDHGSPSKSSNMTISIIVKDVNDCAPYFPDQPYVAYVQENQVGSLPVSIAMVTALDFDSSPNSVMTYWIIDGDTNIFAINKSTGELSALGTFDRETTPQYVLTVQALDSGKTT